MHALRFDRRRLRHTVWVMLLAWAFALLAGAVNACMLAPQVLAGQGLSSDISAHAEGARGERGHDGFGVPDHHREEQSHAAKDNCLEFCDNQSSALSKSHHSSLDSDTPAIVASAPWDPIIPKAHLAKLVIQRPIAQGPPLVIRLLRLTL